MRALLNPYPEEKTSSILHEHVLLRVMPVQLHRLLCQNHATFSKKYRSTFYAIRLDTPERKTKRKLRAHQTNQNKTIKKGFSIKPFSITKEALC